MLTKGFVVDDEVPVVSFEEFRAWALGGDPERVIGVTYCPYNCVLSEFYEQITGLPVTVSDTLYFGDEKHYVKGPERKRDNWENFVIVQFDNSMSLGYYKEIKANNPLFIDLLDQCAASYGVD